jgi:hypothetical protein
LVSGVFGDVGFDDGGGTSGDELGIDGDVGERKIDAGYPPTLTPALAAIA